MERQESTLSGDFINAKVRGMRSKLLEAERLLALTDARTLPELMRRIRPNQPFEGSLAFERDLLRDTIRDLDMVARYLSGDTYHLFEWMMVRYQVENLKVALRFFLAGENRASAQALMAPVPNWLALPLDELFQATDLKRFVAAVPRKELREALEEQLAAERKPDVFQLDSALDGAWLARTTELVLPLGDIVRRMVGYDVDARNALLVLRAKFNYGRSFADVEPFLAHPPHLVNSDLFQKLTEAPDLAQALQRLPAVLLPDDLRPSVRTLSQLEDAFQVQQYRLALRSFAESVLDVAIVIAYYYLKNAELANLIRLTEAVRHSMPREEIDQTLILRER